jgi:hypothetical protein
MTGPILPLCSSVSSHLTSLADGRTSTAHEHYQRVRARGFGPSMILVIHQVVVGLAAARILANYRIVAHARRFNGSPARHVWHPVGPLRASPRRRLARRDARERIARGPGREAAPAARLVATRIAPAARKAGSEAVSLGSGTVPVPFGTFMLGIGAARTGQSWPDLPMSTRAWLRSGADPIATRAPERAGIRVAQTGLGRVRAPRPFGAPSRARGPPGTQVETLSTWLATRDPLGLAAPRIVAMIRCVAAPPACARALCSRRWHTVGPSPSVFGPELGPCAWALRAALRTSCSNGDR